MATEDINLFNYCSGAEIAAYCDKLLKQLLIIVVIIDIFNVA